MFCKVIQSHALIFAVLAQTLARVFRPAAHGLSRVVLRPRDGVFYTSNCDCAFAVRFHSGTSVAGYDPEKYLKQYRDAGSDVNAMRRIDYAARKDAINAQKLAAYAAQSYRNDLGAASKIILTRRAESVEISVKQAEDFRQAGWTITRENRGEYLDALCKKCKEHIDKLGVTRDNVGEISKYAADMYLVERYDEVEAEFMLLRRRT